MESSVRCLAILIGAGVIGAIVGCNKSGEAAADADSGPHAAGKKVFVANCARCHKLDGSGSAGDGKPPSLGKAGTIPQYTVDWLMEFVRDQKSKRPKSRMRGFDDTIKDEDLRALAEFLVSLK
jgi:mono/diheme cytochrome c family protein